MNNKKITFTYYTDEESEPCPPPKKDKALEKIAVQPHISSHEENEAVTKVAPKAKAKATPMPKPKPKPKAVKCTSKMTGLGMLLEELTD